MTAGSNSSVLTAVVIGIISQVWLRRYHPGWYKKYNYILGGALDGDEPSRPAVARYSFDGKGEGELPLRTGQELEILDDRDAA